MKTFLIIIAFIGYLLVLLFFLGAVRADSMLAPDSIVSKRYNYDVRCTCGLLFETKETGDERMQGLVSHTLCYDCFMKLHEYNDIFPSEFRINLFMKTVLAKEARAERFA